MGGEKAEILAQMFCGKFVEKGKINFQKITFENKKKVKSYILFFICRCKIAFIRGFATAHAIGLRDYILRRINIKH
jgi:hypothetical protein